MNEPGSYLHQTESMNLATGPMPMQMQSFHIPQQHHVTLSPNDVLMLSNNYSESEEMSMSNPNNNHMAPQQFDQTLLMSMDERNYPQHLSLQPQTVSEDGSLQPGYVFVGQDYVQQFQYKETDPNLQMYMVTQGEPEPMVGNTMSSEVNTITFNSPPASPTSGPSSYASYATNECPSVSYECAQEPQIQMQAKPDEDDEMDSERFHFRKVVAAYLQYQSHVKKETEKKLHYVTTLPSKQQQILSDYYIHLEEVLTCIETNQSVFDLICSQERKLFLNQDDKMDPVNNNIEELPVPTRFDFEKLQAVMKQIVRDWTLEGEQERSLCYTPIIEEVERRFSMIKEKQDIRILVPGAGLARLAHELVARNYVVEGNEFSLYMLFASNFILNRCGGNKKFKIHPWVHQYSNVLHHLDQIRPVTFPDIDPADISTKARFSMTAGDFSDVYSHPHQQEAWDCLITCFFLDCANNIVSYIERIYGLLKPGGVWISLGPLLYHYADIAGENSIEPPLDFLIEIIKKIGFSIDRNVKLNTKYTENRLSMLSYTYTSAFLCCTKPKRRKVCRITKASRVQVELPPPEMSPPEEPSPDIPPPDIEHADGKRKRDSETE